MLREGQVPGDKQKMFDDFVSEWLVPQFVLPSNTNDLHKVRIELQRWLAGAAPGPPRARLIELTVNGFREILKKKAPAGLDQANSARLSAISTRSNSTSFSLWAK